MLVKTSNRTLKDYRPRSYNKIGVHINGAELQYFNETTGQRLQQ